MARAAVRLSRPETVRLTLLGRCPKSSTETSDQLPRSGQEPRSPPADKTSFEVRLMLAGCSGAFVRSSATRLAAAMGHRSPSLGERAHRRRVGRASRCRSRQASRLFSSLCSNVSPSAECVIGLMKSSTSGRAAGPSSSDGCWGRGLRAMSVSCRCGLADGDDKDEQGHHR